MSLTEMLRRLNELIEEKCAFTTCHPQARPVFMTLEFLSLSHVGWALRCSKCLSKCELLLLCLINHRF